MVVVRVPFTRDLFDVKLHSSVKPSSGGQVSLQQGVLIPGVDSILYQPASPPACLTT